MESAKGRSCDENEQEESVGIKHMKISHGRAIMRKKKPSERPSDGLFERRHGERTRQRLTTFKIFALWARRYVVKQGKPGSKQH
jgi:hypothetical protein